MEEVRKKLKAFNEHYGHQLALAKPGATSAAKKKEVGVTNRTLCQPVFSAGDEPVDPLKVVTVKEAMSQVEFEKGKEQQGCFLVSMFAPRSRSSCLATGNQQLEVHILKESFEVWIVNGGDEAIQSDACELFGFNVGQFSDKSLGRAWWVLKFRANSSEVLRGAPWPRPSHSCWSRILPSWSTSFRGAPRRCDVSQTSARTRRRRWGLPRSVS